MGNKGSTNKEYLKVSISGKNGSIWEKFRERFHEQIERLLDTVVNQDDNTTVRDEAKEFSNALIKYGKAKLNKPVG